MSAYFETFEVEEEDFGESPEVSSDAIEYLPWHKPRKQWVRQHQWWKYIERLLRSRSSKSDRLRYLSLPGKDLLDFHFIREKLAESTQVSLEAVGIIRASSEWETAQINLSRANDLKGMHPDSNVIHQDIDAFGIDNSLLHQKIRGMEPFDVINLDYCDGLCPKNAKSRFDSIVDLVGHQLDLKRDNWLLLITARTGESSLHEEVLDKLYNLLESNISNEDFALEFMEYYSDVSAKRVGQKIEVQRGNLNKDIFSELVVIGFLKWLLPEAIKQGYTLKLNSSARYEVAETDGSDMFSLSVLFKKNRPTPQSQRPVLAPVSEGDIRDTATEPSHAKPLIYKVKSSIQIDDSVRFCPDSYRKLVLDTLDLLEAAGVNTDGYIDQMCSEDLGFLDLDVNEFKESVRKK